MYAPSWTIIAIVIFLVFLIYKTVKNSNNIHGLQHDLNDLEVEIGVMKGEEWAINSERNKLKQERDKKDYYDGKMSDGSYDFLLGADRRKQDGKDPKMSNRAE